VEGREQEAAHSNTFVGSRVARPGERDAVPDMGQDGGADQRCSKLGPGRAPGRA
jgi:hypothetical protein